MHVVITAPPAANVEVPAAARALYDAWNDRRWDDLAALFDSDVEWFHAGRHELVRGAEAVVAMLRSQAEAFPHALIDVRTLRAAGDVVVAEWTVRHARASTTSEVEKPAIVCEVLELRAGRVARASTYGDIVTMLMEFREDWRPPLRAVC
jgi:ketosteroid isomerase-like protein